MTVATSIVLTLSAQASATDAKPNITGIYSDLSYNRAGGDILGTEVFIVYTADENFVAFFQCWQGGSTRPEVVPVEASGDVISFKVPASSIGGGVYKGHITNTGFDGAWTHHLADGTSKEEAIHLMRKLSYWQ